MTVATGTDATVVAASAATVAYFCSHAEPVTVGSTGQRAFASEHRGTIFHLYTTPRVDQPVTRGAGFRRARSWPTQKGES